MSNKLIIVIFIVFAVLILTVPYIIWMNNKIEDEELVQTGIIAGVDEESAVDSLSSDEKSSPDDEKSSPDDENTTIKTIDKKSRREKILEKERKKIEIYTLEDLEKIGTAGYPLDGHYVLKNDIDAGITVEDSYNDGKGWLPIGDILDLESRELVGFNGIFDGNGHKITHLHTNNEDSILGGLFAFISDGIVKNLTLSGMDINGTVVVGGVTAYNRGIIENVTVIGYVDGGINTGGIAGHNLKEGLIRYSDSSIVVEGKINTGGLVGKNEGRIEYSYSYGRITGNDSIKIEPFQEVHIGEIENEDNGIELFNELKSDKRNSENITDNNLKENDIIDNNNEKDEINIPVDYGNRDTGGLVGRNEGDIYNSYSGAPVYGDKNTGGLAGYNGGDIKNSYSTGNVEGFFNIGGLVGNNYGEIYRSYAAGPSEGKEGIGGLAAVNYGKISYSYSRGLVRGELYTGGLVSDNYGAIENSFAAGDIDGKEVAGGFVGVNYKLISNSYTCGNVSGGAELAGFVGLNEGDIRNSYCTNVVKGDSYSPFVANLRKGRIEKSYFNQDRFGENIEIEPIASGKTSEELKDVETFDEWNFEDIWSINDGSSFPYLRWQHTADDSFLSIEQDGEEVDIIDNQVSLSKKPFTIKIRFEKQVGIYVYASFNDNLYNKLLVNPVYEGITINGGGSLIVGDENRSLYVIRNSTLDYFDLPEYYYLFHDQERSRFNRVIERKGFMIGERTFEDISIIDRDTGNSQIDFTDLDEEQLYMFFIVDGYEKYTFFKINFLE